MVSQRKTSLPTKDALRDIAISALIDVSQNAKATPAARAAAARTILESIGDIGRLQELASRAAKPLTELSVDEIDAEIERLQQVPTAKQVDEELKRLRKVEPPIAIHRDIKS